MQMESSATASRQWGARRNVHKLIAMITADRIACERSGKSAKANTQAGSSAKTTMVAIITGEAIASRAKRSNRLDLSAGVS
ncbi:hypothetical protein LBMAG42_50370 [Deltaproteobacteria bacterium]|nr:hypothetical protein LBMAG42_50370 [Deltaproteobacteria bacterium]